MEPNRRQRPIEGAPAEGRRLLGALLAQRRAELGYTRRPAFARARLPLTPSGNLNTRLLADLEEAYRDNFPEGRLRQLAQAYLVDYDSVTAVAHGEADKLIPDEAEAAAPSAPADPGSDSRRSSTVTGEDNAAATWPYAEAVWQRLHELASAGNPDPTGAGLFGEGTDDARAWDDLRLRQLLPLRERVRNIADLRRREAATSPPHSP